MANFVLVKKHDFLLRIFYAKYFNQYKNKKD